MIEIVFIALVIFRIHIIIYRKTQEVKKKNDPIEMKKKKHEKMGITSYFYTKSLIMRVKTKLLA